MPKLLTISIFFFIGLAGPPTNRYWVGAAASNWNSVSNWSTTSGGLPGASVPGSSNAVFFDLGGPGDCSIDATVNVGAITVLASYAGAISQNANTIVVNGAATFSGGSFTGGSANLTIVGTFTLSGNTFTSTSAILELRGDAAFTSGSFAHNNGTVRFNGNSSQAISGISPTFFTLEFVGKANTYTLSSSGNITVLNNLVTSGTSFFNLATGAIDVKGDINSSNTATGSGGDAMININGTGTQNFNGGVAAGAGALPQLTINKASGTLNLTGFPAVSNNFSYSSGTLSAGTSTFCFTHGGVASYTISGSVAFANVEFYVNTGLLTAVIAVATTVTVTGNLTLAGVGSILITTGNINVIGNLTLTNTASGGGGSASINMVGTGSQSIDGSAVTINQSRLPVLTINKASGTLSLLGNISFAANVNYTAGTISGGTSTCYVVNNITVTGSFPVNNFTLSGAANTTLAIAAGSTLTVTGTLDLENGSNYITLNTGTIAVQGDLIDNNTSTIGGGTATILINGTGSQNFTGNSSPSQGILPYIIIQKSAGVLSLNGTISSNRDWSYLSGTVNAGTSTIVFGGNNLAISSSGMGFNNLSIVANTSTVSNNLTVNGNLTISGTAVLAGGANTVVVDGNWSDWGAGGFTESTGTTSLNGSGLQTIGATGAQNFINLSISNSGTGIKLLNNVTVAGTLTMSQGNIDLNTNTLTLGSSTANSGTLSRTAGTIINTGSIVRWFKSATVGSGSVSGLFPVGTATDYRPFYVSAPVTGPTTGGTVALSYNDASTNSVVSIPDGVFTIVVRKDLNWNLITGGGLAGGTFEVQAQGTGFGTVASVTDLRLTQASSVVGTAGTNAGSVSNPQIYRTGLTAANLSNSFYVGSINAINSPLPISLVAFTATPENQGVELKWETSSETDNAYYVVQRSTDTSLWKDLQQIAASGNTNTESYYAAYDPNPVTGNDDYRLKQVDRDGSFTYSPVRQVTLDLPVTVRIYPNPARSFVMIRLVTDNGEKLSVVLMNTAGQITRVPTANTGSQVTLNTAGLAKGLYFVIITHGQKTETGKFILD